jgi:hypothetical protein
VTAATGGAAAGGAAETAAGIAPKTADITIVRQIRVRQIRVRQFRVRQFRVQQFRVISFFLAAGTVKSGSTLSWQFYRRSVRQGLPFSHDPHNVYTHMPNLTSAAERQAGRTGVAAVTRFWGLAVLFLHPKKAQKSPCRSFSIPRSLRQTITTGWFGELREVLTCLRRKMRLIQFNSYDRQNR